LLGNPTEILGAADADTKQTQNPPSESFSEEQPKRRVKFPKVVTHRGQKATIYGRTARYRKYRLCYMAEGRRCTRVFKKYAEALAAAKTTVRQLAKGNAIVAALSKADAHAYRFALAKLSALAADLNAQRACAPDRNMSAASFPLEDVIAEFCAAKRLLPNSPLCDAVKGFLSTMASVRRVNLKTAADEFLAERNAKTNSEAGRRPALSPRMAYQDRLRMDKFTETFGTSDLCDIRADHLDLFFGVQLKDLSPRSRNHHRSTLSVFFKWCIRKSYLPEDHGLRRSNGLCPDGKAKETADVGEVQVYTAKEFAALLTNAHGPLQALVAIGGLAGLRTEELLRLEWPDVWRRPGFVEITGRKAKTRARRLVPIGSALATWLEPFRPFKAGLLWTGKFVSFHEHMRELHAAAKVPRRDNALRHSFISYRLAQVHNEHQVANEAGTSSQMIHRHYRELVTPQEAQEWFAIVPERAKRRRDRTSLAAERISKSGLRSGNPSGM
jgi:integrase